MVVYVSATDLRCASPFCSKDFDGERSPADYRLPELNGAIKTASLHPPENGISTNHNTLPSLLKACARSGSVKQGRAIRGLSMKMDFQRNPKVAGSLIHMYCKCGCIDEARRLFDKIPVRNLVVWSILIDGYAKNGYPGKAVELFRLMVEDDLMPNDVTAIAVLSMCDLKGGRLVHGMVEKLGLSGAVLLGTAVINMYFRCNDPGSACRVFDCMPEQDHVVWSTMVVGFVLNGLFEEALKYFVEMISLDLKLEPLGIVNVFKACLAMGDFQTAEEIHRLLDKKGILMNMNVSSALIDMYMKFGKFEVACQIFDKMPKKDVVAWTTMVSGFADWGCSREVLGYFDDMMKASINPNEVMLASALSACAHSGILGRGVWIHQYIEKKKLGPSVMLANALMDMYAKCGSIEVAMKLFEGMSVKDISSWNVIINALARHGASRQSLDLFEEMLKYGIRPNSITFVGILSACSHGALMNSGRQYF
ncbi:pentatricopeptide repeat-containing protein At1g11290, chloroplastic-like [Nymphaea colorata]|uniref:Pentacotripeptide-repeat region of PRORP domain-containing protein n=1 Tax=Nymphaea colorata TaxID=210225 RepID=A0A5K1DE60_9MAGN|nr:pentatricopeptide repeat-containing protein At1g11290, chloroplastic-like [Nymphaea colorata]